MLKSSNLDLSIDRYAITVAYSLFLQNKHKEQGVFEVFYRKPCTSEFPFVVFAGTHFVLSYLQHLKFTDSDIEYLKKDLPDIKDQSFFDYLQSFSAASLAISSIPEGNFVYGNVPLLRFCGDTALLLVFESPMLAILNLCSSASTAAFLLQYHARGKPIVEMGLRRAYGIEAGYICSAYGAMSGFKSTSNVVIGKDFGLPTVGTMSHSFILSFDGNKENFNDVNIHPQLLDRLKMTKDQFFEAVWARRIKYGFQDANIDELKAYLSYISAFPANFVALVDTYNTHSSGIKNFALCATLLRDAGYEKLGIRIDSGDLIQESLLLRSFLKTFDTANGYDLAKVTNIIASNDVNVEFLKILAKSSNEIDIIGIGTNFTTFKDIKPIGFVYKLSQLDGHPRFKIASGLDKATLPFDKDVYRVITDDDKLFLLARVKDSGLKAGPYEGFVLDPKSGTYEKIVINIASIERLLEPVTWPNGKLDTGAYSQNFKACLEHYQKRSKYAEGIVYAPEIIQPLLEALKKFKD